MPPIVKVCDCLLGYSRPVARTLALTGAWLLLVCAVLICIDVVLRRVFEISTWGADEFSYYALAIASTWSLAFAMLEKAHIRIDLVRNALAAGKRVVFDVVALLAMTCTSLVFSSASWHIFERSWTRGVTSITQLAVPLWIPQSLWVLGFFLLSLVCLLIVLRVMLALLIERSVAAVTAEIGVIDTETEVADALNSSSSSRSTSC